MESNDEKAEIQTNMLMRIKCYQSAVLIVWLQPDTDQSVQYRYLFQVLSDLVTEMLRSLSLFSLSFFAHPY
jgi:uncharacterized protein with von Willebrand factor type A (vWA) domain